MTTEPTADPTSDPNAALSRCRAAVGTARALELTPGETDPVVELSALRGLLADFINLDRQLSAAGPLPKEWGAQRSLMIVVRDPDSENQFYGEGEPVGCYDIDLGRCDLSDADERAGWLEAQRELARELELLKSTMCLAVVNGTIAAVEERYGGDT